jgi:CDP-diacylglycerol---glycerol-3-phosphate 3-phosphatidyltransferase
MSTAEVRDSAESVVRRHWLADAPGGLLGLPNRITLVRTVLVMAFAAVLFQNGSWLGLLIGYVLFWAGDSLDGTVARWRHEETVAGAVFDIVSDRACTFLLAGAFIASYPESTVPLVLFLFQFGVVDTMLSLSFLLWPGVISPNYFYLIDRPSWRWNWWTPAKVLNCTLLVLALVLGLQIGSMWPAYVAVAVASAIKIGTSVRLLRILTGRVAAKPGG